jgi:hypothetical protein
VVACEATDDHCCYIAGPPCRYLRDDGTGAALRWVCTLRERLGSWDEVHRDAGYLEHVAPVVRSVAGVDCGDWPPKGETCNACGVTGG